MQDLQEIGIDRVGFRYRLTGEISQEKLQLFESGVPVRMCKLVIIGKLKMHDINMHINNSYVLVLCSLQ